MKKQEATLSGSHTLVKLSFEKLCDEIWKGVPDNIMAKAFQNLYLSAF